MLGLVTEGCIVGSDHMLVEPLQMLCAEAADALAPGDRNRKPDDLLSPLHLMCILKKLYSS